jgi:hypothetical protein
MDSGVDSGVAPPPPTDSGVAPFDSGVAPRDSGTVADASTPPPSASDPMFISWPSQHTRSNSAWGAELTDIIRHLPLSYGDTYADADLVTYGHETTHGINSHLRNYRNTTGRRANGFYVMNDRGVIVVEPNIRKSAVAAYVPASLRGSRFALYVQGSSDWDDRPLYLFDEWIAYTNGSEVGVGLARAGLWRYGWRDAVAGTLEFVVYAMAVGMAVEAGDPAYFRSDTQFRALIQWNTRRAMALYREGAASPHFRWDTQDNYWRALKTSPDAEALRTFVRRTFGRAWAAEVLGLDP